MTRFVSAIAFMAMSVGRAQANNWYPDWDGGSGTCLDKTVTPSTNHLFQEDGSSFLTANLDACCDRYYLASAGDTADCKTGAADTDSTGTDEYTVRGDRCSKNCPTTEGAECGGLVGSSVTKFNSADACCAQTFGYIRREYCTTISHGGTYGGTGKWYLDSGGRMCVQDCATSTDTACGGVSTQNWQILSDTLEDCCSARLSYLNQEFCVVQSTPTLEGTDTWFVDDTVGRCRQFCTATTTGSQCGTYTTSRGDLYPDAAACCSARLNWQNSEYCTSRSTDPDTGTTNKWFVDYNLNACVRDCTTSATHCDSGLTASDTLFDTSTACCAAKLGSVDSDSCVSVSESGVANATATGTSKWYADYSSSRRCVVDCPTNSGNPTCGGTVSTGAGVSFYDTVEQCCSEKFQWYQSDLCKVISEAGTVGNGHTNLWYAKQSDNVCVQDCASSGGVSCEGNPSSFSEPLYDTAAACCSAKLGWLNQDRCETQSTLGASAPLVGGRQWFAHTGSTCGQDCVTAEGQGCVGVVDQISGVQFYSTVAECCTAKFSWINSDLCVALSDGGSGHSFKFYPDQGARVCRQDCDGAAPCGGSPSNLAVPVFDNIASCCSTAMSWQNKFTCEQTPAAEAGTDQYWINWQLNKCVKNCVTSQGRPCGGLAESWDVLYGSVGDCCGQPAFSWKELSECAYT